MDGQYMKPKTRELTRAEMTAVKKLVKNLCANYDYEYGCLPLDDACYMLYGVAYNCSALCRYFRNAVLPNDPALEAVFLGMEKVETEPCAFCGKEFVTRGKRDYCSSACQKEANRKNTRERMRKQRNAGSDV